MIVIAAITFGHHGDDVATALASARSFAQTQDQVRVVALDDASGHPPTCPADVELHVTPQRMGFSAAVNHILSVIAPDASRLILVNPDASLETDAIRDLANSEADAEVPTVDDGAGRFENVRPALTAKSLLRGWLLVERLGWADLPLVGDLTGTVECPPYAPAGTVISLKADLLRQYPLAPEMFWLEFSDWVYRLDAAGHRLQLKVNDHRVHHVGASTSVSFPVSVATSQAYARVNFIRRYGSPVERALLPIAVALRALRFGVKQRAASSGWFFYRAATGRADWRVSA